MVFKNKNISYKFLLIVIVILCVCQTQSLRASRASIIKVLIAKDKKIRIRADRSIPLTIKGQRFSNKKIKGLTLRQAKNKTTIYFDKNRQKIFDLKNKDKFEVVSTDGRGIWVGQKRYAGKLRIFILDSEILVVNILGFEKYLSSVVGSEMPVKWPIEALKAQAIASRTYALKQKGNFFYDIDSTNKNQVYIGLEAKTHKTTKAVVSTRSLVLTYKNKLINAVFHSSSGGMTENSKDVWKNQYPYLSSVKDFDKNNPKLVWQEKFSNENLQKLFPRIGRINNIQILNITDTGRVKNIKIQGELGSEVISGTDLRKRMNLKSSLVRFKLIEDIKNKPQSENSEFFSSSKPKNLPIVYVVKPGDNLYDIALSNNVTINQIVKLNSIKDTSLININQRLILPRNPVELSLPLSKSLVVSGYGSGHGVGMSQWGAKYLANKGVKAEDILKHFYKGVKVQIFKKYFL